MSRDYRRIPRMLKKLEQAWAQDPDARLTQLIVNCVDSDFLIRNAGDPYYYEDTELERGLDEFLKRGSEKITDDDI